MENNKNNFKRFGILFLHKQQRDFWTDHLEKKTHQIKK